MIKINNILKYFLLTGSIFSAPINVHIQFAFCNQRENVDLKLDNNNNARLCKSIFTNQIVSKLIDFLSTPGSLLHQILFNSNQGLPMGEKMQFKILKTLAESIFQKYCTKDLLQSDLYMGVKDLEHIISLPHPIVELILNNKQIRVVRGYAHKVTISEKTYIFIYDTNRKRMVLNSRMKQILTTFFESPNQSETGDMCIMIKEANNYLLQVRLPQNIQNPPEYYMQLISTLERQCRVITQGIKEALITLKHYLHCPNLPDTFQLTKNTEYQLKAQIGQKSVQFNFDIVHEYLYLPEALPEVTLQNTYYLLLMLEENNLLQPLALEIKNKVENLSLNTSSDDVFCLNGLGIIQHQINNIYKIGFSSNTPFFFTEDFTVIINPQMVVFASITIKFFDITEIAKIKIEGSPISTECIKDSLELETNTKQTCLLFNITKTLPPAIKKRFFNEIARKIYIAYQRMGKRELVPDIIINDLSDIIGSYYKVRHLKINKEERTYYLYTFFGEKIFLYTDEIRQSSGGYAQCRAIYLLKAAKRLSKLPGQDTDEFLIVTTPNVKKILFEERLKGAECIKPCLRASLNIIEPEISPDIATILRRYVENVCLQPIEGNIKVQEVKFHLGPNEFKMGFHFNELGFIEGISYSENEAPFVSMLKRENLADLLSQALKNIQQREQVGDNETVIDLNKEGIIGLDSCTESPNTIPVYFMMLFSNRVAKFTERWTLIHTLHQYQ